MKIFQGLISLLKSDPIQNKHEAIEQAIKSKAVLASDLEFNRVMADFHTERVLEIDHTMDWWGYANHRQKQFDYQMDAIAVEKKLLEANARVEANKLALAAMLKVDNESASN